MRRTWIEVSLNLLFWLLTGWLILSSYSVVLHEVELVNGEEKVRIERSGFLISALSLVLVVAALLFYANLKNTLRLSENAWTRVLPVSLGLLAISIMVYHVVANLIFKQPGSPLPHELSSGLLVFYFAVSSAYGVGIVWARGEEQRRQLALEKKQSELNLLRNQLQPHFLFNVLNNLLSMVDQQANPQMAQSLDRLSGLLRYVVDETNAETVTLKREIEFLKNYADLQLLRFVRDEVDFRLEIMGNPDNRLVEPGLFLPFVENAFRYGAEPESHSVISVQFDLTTPDAIGFRIENPMYPQLRSNSHGTGIASVKRRLELVYPDRHSLKITENEVFLAELKLYTHARHHR